MANEQTINEIRENWREFYPTSKDGKGIICPLCGHGKNGDGIIINKTSKNHSSLICFGCGFKGDILDLIQQDQGTDFKTALQYAADRLHIDINAPQVPTEKSKAAAEPQEREEIKEPKFNFTEYYKRCSEALKDNKEAISYLSARGISSETIERFNLGYDANWKCEIVKWRYEQGISDKPPIASKRIVIPINKNYHIARAIDPDNKIQKMNSGGEIDIFNFDIVPGNKEPIFIVEGVFDAMSFYEVGAQAIALNSTSNVNKLLEKIRATGARDNYFIIGLDNDGNRATLEAQKRLKNGLDELGIKNIVGDVTGRYKDANEALTGNKDEFLLAINREIEKIKLLGTTKKDSALNYINSAMQKDIEQLKAASNIYTGFAELDGLSGGLYPGLYVIAAISSLGKTTFSHQIADNLAASGKDVLFFSLEQSKLELVSKSLARLTVQEDQEHALTSLEIRQGNGGELLNKAIEKYKKAAANISIIEGNFDVNIDTIREYISSYVKTNRVKPIVFIDYLQIIQPGDRKGTTKENIDFIVTELKRLSRDLNITIFLISSVNRANYLTPIDFESLKESGGIEFTADVIFGLQLECLNEDLFNETNKIKQKRERIKQAKKANPRKIELVCLKNRYGISNFSCVFDYYPKHDYFTDFIQVEETPFADIATTRHIVV